MNSILFLILYAFLALLLIGVIVLMIGIYSKLNSHSYSDDKTAALLTQLSSGIKQDLSNIRVEQSGKLDALNQATAKQMTMMTSELQQQLTNVGNSNLDTLVHISDAISNRLAEQRHDNARQLEQIRLTVDERLQKTLESRLGESFRLVSERLEQVHQGLGEMQSLAASVGDLKRTLTNVKVRGTMGEVQLESLLEQMLSPGQYDKNVKVDKFSDSIVEFAVKLPGKEDGFVYLPIDAKFPVADYNRLLDAYDTADPTAIAVARKELDKAIKRAANDISAKYIKPPATTDFAIMFLPIEGLFAEVIRDPDAFDYLRRELKIVVAGPTTLTAMLNSLQMGFKTLAIEKRSSEVWEILTSIRTEFTAFSEVLEKTQRKLSETGQELDKLVGVRSRGILRQLSKIERAGDGKNIEA